MLTLCMRPGILFCNAFALWPASLCIRCWSFGLRARDKITYNSKLLYDCMPLRANHNMIAGSYDVNASLFEQSNESYVNTPSPPLLETALPFEIGNLEEIENFWHQDESKARASCLIRFPICTMGVFLEMTKNMFLPVKRVYSMNTYSSTHQFINSSTVPHGIEQSE